MTEKDNVFVNLPRTVELTFLDAVAKAYVDQFNDLSEFCFVFPNKRAGTFFLRSVTRFLNEKAILSPEVLSISDFVENLSGRQVASRLDLIFRLYNIYKSISNKKGVGEIGEIVEFDSFRSWGEIVLSDFSEVDQYVADPKQVFKNLKDLHDIESNFLTEEQREVLQEYFGYTPSIENIDNFWKSVETKEGKESQLKTKFMRLWDMLIPMYDALTESLTDSGLTTAGGAYKLALERLKEKGRELLKWKRVVMVGFNTLSTSEVLIFSELKKINNQSGEFADFYWDFTGPVLSNVQSDASKFLRINNKKFPSPDWAADYLKQCSVDKMPPLCRVYASPSNAAQAKIAGDCVGELASALGNDDINAAKVAVVLPDENLLLPLLHAIPEDLKNINLTMGYSLKLTSTATFLHHLRCLHQRSSKANDDVSFYGQDVKMLLAHPFTHFLLGSETVARLNTMMAKGHRISVLYSDLKAIAGESIEFLNIKDYADSTEGVIAYIDGLLMSVDKALEGKSEGVVKSELDRAHIERYRDGLQTLKNSAFEHNIKLGLTGVFFLVDKLLSGEKITFEGEPLAGLQVMGLLETRALDFEHLIVLSMNDKVMPMKSRHATFIPDGLRIGYGLPSANYHERLFSYYFYRMISRAKSVTLIYDARSGEGMRSGGESRYLMQLRYLFNNGKMEETKYRFSLTNSKRDAQPVEKSDEIMEEIKKYAQEGTNRNFSASALKKYNTCQVKFFYEEILGVKTDDEDSVFIDAISLGNILHDTMLNLYLPNKNEQGIYLSNPKKITAEYIDNIMSVKVRNDKGQDVKSLIEEEVRKSVYRKFYGIRDDEDIPNTELTGSVAMTATYIVEQVKSILNYDRTLTPFDFVGGEISHSYRYEYEPGKKVNMKYAIDRLDILSGEQWRIVDYKTGESHVTGNSVDDIFDGNYKVQNLFQLMLYANLMNLDTNKNEKVRVVIYQPDSMANGDVVPMLGNDTINDHIQINDQFLERLNSMISEIFNQEKPFEPTDREGNCGYCKLKQLCGKE